MDNVEKIKTLGIYDLSDVPYTIASHHALQLLDIDFFNFPAEMDNMSLVKVAIILYVINNKKEALEKIYSYLGFLETLQQLKDIDIDRQIKLRLSADQAMTQLSEIAIMYLDDTNGDKQIDDVKLELWDYWKRNVAPYGNIIYKETQNIKDLKKKVMQTKQIKKTWKYWKIAQSIVFIIAWLKLKKSLLKNFITITH